MLSYVKENFKVDIENVEDLEELKEVLTRIVDNL